MKNPCEKSSKNYIEEVILMNDIVVISIEDEKQKFVKSLSEKYTLREDQKFEIYSFINEKGQLVLTAISTRLDGTLTKEDFYFHLKGRAVNRPFNSGLTDL